MTEADASEAPVTAVRARLEGPLLTPFMLSLALISVASTSVGVALAPSLLRIDALLLAVCSPYPHHVLLASVDYPLSTLLPAIGLRRALDAGALYWLGHRWGDRAIEHVGRRFPGLASSMRRMERWFAAAALPLVFVLPSSATYILSGSVGIALRKYVPVVLISQTLWTTSVFWAADIGREFIEPVAALMREHFVAATVVSVGAVLALWLGRKLWPTRTGRPRPLNRESAAPPPPAKSPGPKCS